MGRHIDGGWRTKEIGTYRKMHHAPARTDSGTPRSNGITTETAAHTSQTHMNLDASPFQLNLFFHISGLVLGLGALIFSLASPQGQEMCRIAADTVLKCQMARRRRLVFLACWIGTWPALLVRCSLHPDPP